MAQKKQNKKKNEYSNPDKIMVLAGAVIGVFISLIVFPIEAIQMPAFILSGILALFCFVLMAILDGAGASNRLISLAFGLAAGFFISMVIIIVTVVNFGVGEYDSFSKSWFKQVIG